MFETGSRIGEELEIWGLCEVLEVFEIGDEGWGAEEGAGREGG